MQFLLQKSQMLWQKQQWPFFQIASEPKPSLERLFTFSGNEANGQFPGTSRSGRGALN